jgi:hypothetical protein
MPTTPEPIAVYVEATDKRAFAGAIDWPGWTRGGKTAEEALMTLAAYRPRYAEVLRAAHLRPPSAEAPLEVTERLRGGSGTEYGVASVAPAADDAPLEGSDVDRALDLLGAAWAAFDRAATAAEGTELSKGPKGGGRDLGKMLAHIVEAERAYIGALGAKAPPESPAAKDTKQALKALADLHDASREALRAKVRGELPDVGARGGKRWSARYFVRRSTWHALDHAWEIEDRST